MTVHQEALDSRVTTDTLPYGFIANIHHRFKSKIFSPLINEDATSNLLAVRQNWLEQGSVTVFTGGVFDMLHLDHAGYLLHTKAAGAAFHYAKNHCDNDPTWAELTPDRQQAYTCWALGNSAVRLIVSVDGDQSVAVRKSNNSAKGGGARPVYGWETRALMVASQAYCDPIDVSSERLLPIADAVTIHGPHDFLDDSPHANHFNLVGQLQPDMWAFFGESRDIFDEAPLRHELGGVALHCILDGDGTHYFEDSFMGKMSTTNIVKRVTLG